MAKTDLLTGDVRALTLKIAAPSVAAMLAASVCPLLEALVLSARDASLSAAVGASLALILLEQTVGFTLGMGAAIFTGVTDISQIMVKAGLGMAGLLIIILSTVTTTFLDAYSAGVSSVSISETIRIRLKIKLPTSLTTA